MRTKKIGTIIGLSREIQPVIESAVALLQSAPQNVFIFELGEGLNLPAAPTPETPRPWSELEAVLVGERKHRRCEYLIGVLNEPIENNWFSHTAYGKMSVGLRRMIGNFTPICRCRASWPTILF